MVSSPGGCESPLQPRTGADSVARARLCTGSHVAVQANSCCLTLAQVVLHLTVRHLSVPVMDAALSLTASVLTALTRVILLACHSGNFTPRLAPSLNSRSVIF